MVVVGRLEKGLVVLGKRGGRGSWGWGWQRTGNRGGDDTMAWLSDVGGDGVGGGWRRGGGKVMVGRWGSSRTCLRTGGGT